MGAAGAVITLALASLVFVRPHFSGGLRFEPRFDLAVWLHDLPGHLHWLLPFAALTAMLPAARALAWGRTLPLPPVDFANRYHAVALGGLMQNVLPGHLGPFGSALFLSRRLDRSFAAVLASLLLLKWLELVALVALATLAVAWPAAWVGQASIRKMVAVGAAVCAVAAIALVLIARFTPAWVDRLERRGRLLWLARALESLGDGLAVIGSARRLARAALVAATPVVLGGIAYGLALSRMGAAPGVVGGWPLLAAITLAQVTPGLPIGTGVYYFVCAWAAREMGVSASQAAALALLSHATGVVTNLTVGLGSALVHRRFFAELVAWRRARQAAARPAPP